MLVSYETELSFFAQKAGEDTTAMIKNTEDNKKSAAEKEAEVREVFEQLNSKLQVIGSLVHDSVPVSNDEVYDLVYFLSS